MNISDIKSKVSINDGRDFIHNFELLIELTKKDIKIKYRNSVLGIVWVILQPILLSFLLLFVRKGFSVGIKTFELTYFDMYAILIPWQFFTSALLRSVDCFTANYVLMSRINFPKILLPLSIIASSLIDVLISIFAYSVLAMIFKQFIFLKLVSLLLIILISTFFISALCLLFSLIQCFISQFRQSIPYITNLSLFALPMLYSENSIPKSIKYIYERIPLIWMITATKECFTGSFENSIHLLPEVLLIGIVFCFLAYLIFKRFQNIIIDYI